MLVINSVGGKYKVVCYLSVYIWNYYSQLYLFSAHHVVSLALLASAVSAAPQLYKVKPTTNILNIKQHIWTAPFFLHFRSDGPAASKSSAPEGYCTTALLAAFNVAKHRHPAAVIGHEQRPNASVSGKGNGDGAGISWAGAIANGYVF